MAECRSEVGLALRGGPADGAPVVQVTRRVGPGAGGGSEPLVVLAALVTLLFAGGCSGPIADTDGDRERLDRRHEDLAAALAERDAERIAAIFAEDAVIHVAERDPIQGRTAILPFYQNLFGFMTASALTPERTQISDSGDMAFSVGSTSNEFRGPEGLVTYRGKFVLIWTRRDGDWLISAYAISGNQAPVE